MNNKQKIIIAVCSVFVIGLLIMALVNSKPDVNCTNPEFANYISAYTEGTISKNSTIRVILNSELAEKIDKQAKAAEGLIKIYPKVKGSSKFVDDRTIEFTPEQSFSSGKEYVAEFNLGKITEVDKAQKKFVFPFSIIKQDLKVVIEEQVTTDRKTLKFQQIAGSVKTADWENLNNIKNSVSAEYNNKKIDIKWKENDVAEVFNFTIDSIERGESSGNLIIKYDGIKIGSNTKGKKEIKIPGLNEFYVNKIDVTNEPSQFIRISFTDPLKEGQSLKGLINVIDNDSYVEYKIQAEDNSVCIYPSTRKSGEINVTVSSGIENLLGYKTAEDKTYTISFESLKPQVRTVKSGVILPDSENGLVYPFEAVNLKAVDVTIIKVLEKNLLSYVRDYSDYYNNSNLQRTGVPVFRKTIHIADAESEEVQQWNRYYLELSKLINTEPGTIYNIKISFRKSLAVFDCDTCGGGDPCNDEQDIDIKDFDNCDYNYYSIDNSYYESAGWNWENSSNPCYKMYYEPDKFIEQSILASNLGMIAKKGDDKSLTVFVTDLKTARPVNDAIVEIYGYQQQLLEKKTTNSDGKAEFGKLNKAYFAIAKHDKQANYLKLEDGNSLSMSKFNISGNEIRDGLKGYLYGERGVWRPGDSIHVTFVLKEDKTNPLPADYPITFTVDNPRSQQIEKQTVKKNKSNFYVFSFKTDENDVTGNYQAQVTCGNARFYKQLRVENIKPNRLKINTDFNKKELTPSGNIMKISSAWLHGAPASNLKATIQQTLSQSELKFDQWEGYSFGNARSSYFESYPEFVFEGNLDANGNAQTSLTYKNTSSYSRYPSKMKAKFDIKVFEKGGNFSRDYATMDVYPYERYIGIKLPFEENSRYLYVDRKHKVNLAVVDNKGNVDKKQHTLAIKLYKLTWQWWYDANNYVSDYQTTLIDSDTITLTNTGSWEFNVKYPEWGRFMIEVNDLKTNEVSSQIFYMDWPGYFGRSPMMSQGSTIVELSSEKQKYNVGENVKINIPTTEGGQALVSIESGSKVLRSQWISTQKDNTTFEFKAEDKMEPGVYVVVTLLQPHAQTANDLPIRMYGVLPIDIENPATILKPEIDMPDVIQAESEVKITVSEKDNKPMTYTLALVDDGILDLTHFKTPNPWKEFYSREALKVKTFDMYDNVIGAFGGKIEKMFSIGGDDENQETGNKKANNFETVVAFLGPFTTDGGKKTHTIKMPKYIGSVRAMVVAGNDRAYGNAEKQAIVNKPLMIFATTPRVLSTNEKFKLPITVFTGNDNIKNVTVKIKASDGFKAVGETTKTLTFSKKGEQNPTFELETSDNSGIGTVEITAISGNEHSVMTLNVQIREPNVKQQQTITKVVAAGETIDLDFTPIGRKNTNSAKINVSGILPINLDYHIDNLLNNPYVSLAQIVNEAFPLLYISKITDLSNKDKDKYENIIRNSIKEIYNYQTSGGGLSYWRNTSYSDVELTNYAGHFLLEAQKAGYTVKTDFISKWKKYQRLKAESWTPDNRYSYTNQAYRLYTLALANEANNGQMNRLKQQKNITEEAQIYLAGAYALSGKESIGTGIINQLKKTYTTNSPEKLIVLCDLNIKNEAFNAAKYLSDELNSEDYWETYERESQSLVAVGKYFTKYTPASQVNCSYVANGKTENINSQMIYVSNNLDIKSNEPQSISFTNKTKGTLYVEIVNQGIPEVGKEKEESSILKAEIKYVFNGKEISPKSLPQGTEFQAIVKITNPTNEYMNRLAITEIFPSGWEISNSSISSNSDDDDDYGWSYNSSRARIDYTDIRDDRKYTYFTLPSKCSIEFRTQLVAAYQGTYYLPGVVCNNLENSKIFVKTKGTMVEVE